MNKITSKNNMPNFVFFGGDKFSEKVLDTLKEHGLVPNLIITNPDRPSGRGMELKSALLKIWAEKNNSEILQPEKIDYEFINHLENFIKENKIAFFVVASFGKILPAKIVNMPKHGTLNIHPSLLPMYRGATPIESAILDDQKETGVTIMLMDEKMDHGPILNQEFLYINEWKNKVDLEEEMAEIGGNLLAETIPLWLSDQVESQTQNHELATFTKKITKEDGKITLEEIRKADYKLFLKVVALNPWPGVYFFINKDEHEMRIKITKAEWNGEKTVIAKVIPEGKKEMNYSDFKRNFSISD